MTNLKKPAGNRRLAKKRVQWLIEHSTSYQVLCWVDSLVLRIPLLRQAPKRWRLFHNGSKIMEENEDKKEIYFKRVYDNIKNIGYHTTAIMEEENFTPFAYSTGIFENFKIPELFISGLGPNLSGELIKNYVEKFKFGKVPLNERLDNLSEKFPVYLIKVGNEDLTEYTLTSIKFYEKRDYEYLQLIFPDLNGNFPNETNYDYDQKIIGEFNA